jgi:hypothetical protein
MLRQNTKRYFQIICAGMCLIAVEARAQEGSASSSSGHSAMVSMLIEYEPALQEVSAALNEVLSIRLGKYGVELSARALNEKKSATAEYVWVVTLRRISERHLIVTIDSTEPERSISEVRTVSWQRETEQLAWTMALVVEETVTPYLEIQGELPALGAGLAIIEPEEVGGTKKRTAVIRSSYPRFYALGIGLAAAGIWTVEEVISGPKVFVKGIFSHRTVALFALGWLGSASYGAANITGTLSLIPIELYVGNIFVYQKVFKIIGWAGVSLGFAVYKSQYQDISRLEMTFQPGGNLLVEMTARIISSLNFFLHLGCSFPFVRDVLVNNDVQIYKHVWIMPMFSTGLQLVF